jgi:YD repeat-containing protein
MPQPTPPSVVRINKYIYDGLQRLVTASESPTTTLLYGYDNAGNRTSVSVNGTSTTYAYNTANQITNSGYSYDNAGNLLTDGSATL